MFSFRFAKFPLLRLHSLAASGAGRAGGAGAAGAARSGGARGAERGETAGTCGWERERGHSSELSWSGGTRCLGVGGTLENPRLGIAARRR